MADQTQQPNPAPVDPALKSATPATDLPLQPKRSRWRLRRPKPANPPVPTRQARGTRTSPPARLAYIRHATPGNDDDLIRAKALITFWKVMVVVGGVAILFLIFLGGQYVARQQTTVPPPGQPLPVPVTAPNTGDCSNFSSNPVTVPAPQIIVVPVPQPVQQVAF